MAGRIGCEEARWAPEATLVYTCLPPKGEVESQDLVGGSHGVTKIAEVKRVAKDRKMILPTFPTEL